MINNALFFVHIKTVSYLKRGGYSMAKDPKSKKVSKAKAAKNTVDVEIAAEVVDDSKPKLKKGKKPKKTYN